MFFFRRLKLRAKLSFGFGAIVVILMLAVLFGYFGLTKISDNFNRYRVISTDDTLAGKIQSNLLESRLHFKTYIQTGDLEQQKEFEEHFTAMEGFIGQLKKNSAGSDMESKINKISEYAKEYKNGFKDVVDYTGERDGIYNVDLSVKMLDMEDALSHVMEASYKNSNETLNYGASNALKSLLLARMFVNDCIETNDPSEGEKVAAAFTEMDKWLDLSLKAADTAEMKQIISGQITDKEAYINSFNDIAAIIEKRNTEINNMNDIGPKITSLAEEVKQDISSEQDALAPIVKKSNEKALLGMLILAFLALLISVFIITIIVNIVVNPVRTVTNTFREISEGEEADLGVRLKVGSTDELGDMAKFFNHFMVKLQAIMLNSKAQNWLKTGQAELNEKMRGEQDIEKLSSSIITYISKYVNAQIGAIYIKTEDSLYKMFGSYAYKRRKSLNCEIRPGEGLVGQAVLEKQSIIISNVPEDYVAISSGVGEALPRSILVTPCIYNNEVKCIIELGSFDKFTDMQLEFIEQVGESIAIATQSTESRIKMKELLGKTLEQSEELQVQQEELRQSNEELEEQSRALKESETRLQAQQEELRQSNEELEEQAKVLKESEARLQSQQEELRVTNEELAERTKSLEQQKNDIFDKNEHLKNAQKDIEEKAKALEVASKYKSEFLANMSHELRTPLNSIIVLSQMLAEKKDGTPLSDKQLEFAKTIHSSGEDLLKLINDILDLSKVEAGKLDVVMEKVNLEELVQYVERSFTPIASQKGLDFDMVIGKDAPKEIVSDTQRVVQIVNNLLSNAFKFTQAGGVTLTISRLDNGQFQGMKDHGGELVGIAVSDTGIGIAPEKQDIIFEAFKQSDGTTSRKYGGTGLGLSISRELAALLGGRITLVSEPEKGSTFTLILPVEPKSSGASAQAAATRDDNSSTDGIDLVRTKKSVVKPEKASKNITNDDREKIGPNEKVLLIIEDDRNFSNILLDLAHEKGYKCIVAEDGESGLELAGKYGPDAILLDIGLPDINGWRVIDKLKLQPHTGKIPVHVVSGSDMKNPAEKLDGIVGYLKKPVNLESLDAAFKRIESVISKPFKKLLIVDENKQQVDAITGLIGAKDIQITFRDSGFEALSLLENEQFDCMILDLKLQDMSGFELLEKLRDKNITELPVIIHTDKALTQDDESNLRKYAESIIIKGSRSIDRLVAETSLFLHDVDSRIEENRIKAIKSEQEKEDSLKNKKVLIVDDDMRNVFALSSALEEKGMKVVAGRNGREGIQKLDQNPDIDLILMDIMMPEMDGYTAMREIRRVEKNRKIPIIALTAKAMKDDKQKCIEAGANDYLTKPLDIDKLTSLLRVWLYK